SPLHAPKQGVRLRQLHAATTRASGALTLGPVLHGRPFKHDAWCFEVDLGIGIKTWEGARQSNGIPGRRSKEHRVQRTAAQWCCTGCVLQRPTEVPLVPAVRRIGQSRVETARGFHDTAELQHFCFPSSISG
ncbi:unnamed protein product, partial [Scytosiphon promiscuus]